MTWFVFYSFSWHHNKSVYPFLWDDVLVYRAGLIFSIFFPVKVGFLVLGTQEVVRVLSNAIFTGKSKSIQDKVRFCEVVIRFYRSLNFVFFLGLASDFQRHPQRERRERELMKGREKVQERDRDRAWAGKRETKSERERDFALSSDVNNDTREAWNSSISSSHSRETGEWMDKRNRIWGERTCVNIRAERDERSERQSERERSAEKRWGIRWVGVDVMMEAGWPDTASSSVLRAGHEPQTNRASHCSLCEHRRCFNLKQKAATDTEAEGGKLTIMMLSPHEWDNMNLCKPVRQVQIMHFCGHIVKLVIPPPVSHSYGSVNITGEGNLRRKHFQELSSSDDGKHNNLVGQINGVKDIFYTCNILIIGVIFPQNTSTALKISVMYFRKRNCNKIEV